MTECGNYRTLPAWIEDNTDNSVIICRRSALIMHGMITGNIYESNISIYSQTKDKAGYNIYSVPKNGIIIQLIRGHYVTSPEQTIIDMLSDGNMYDAELAEGLADYYYSHAHSFSELNIPEYLQNIFNEYKEWALSYYCAG